MLSAQRQHARTRYILATSYIYIYIHIHVCLYLCIHALYVKVDVLSVQRLHAPTCEPHTYPLVGRKRTRSSERNNAGKSTKSRMWVRNKQQITHTPKNCAFECAINNRLNPLRWIANWSVQETTNYAYSNQLRIGVCDKPKKYVHSTEARIGVPRRNKQQITHTLLHGYAVYIMLSVAVSVALSTLQTKKIDPSRRGKRSRKEGGLFLEKFKIPQTWIHT